MRFSAVTVEQDGSLFTITLLDATGGHELWLSLTNEAGAVERIPFERTGTTHVATIDVSRFADADERRLAVDLIDGRVKLQWDHVPWHVGDIAPWVHADQQVLLTCEPRQAAQLSIVVQPSAPPAPAVTTRRLRSTKKGLFLDAEVLVAPHKVDAIDVRAVARYTGEVRVFPADVHELPSPEGPLRRYVLTCDIDWQALPLDADEEFFDLSVTVTSSTVGESSSRLRGPVGLVAQFARLRAGRVDRGATGTFYDPRYTFKARVLTVYAATLPGDSLREFNRLSRGLRVRRWLYRMRHRPLWLIGELPYKAQDTGAAFFGYVCREHPEIDARYVVAADSPDFDSVNQLGPVVTHGSVEHVRSALLADRIVGSHHADYVFPARVPAVRRKVHAPLIFLQHGVMGTKWMSNLYGKGLGGFTTDLFLVSSPRERALIERDFHYRRDQIAITGLSRFDTLLAPSEPLAQIVVIPTWRDWITTSDQFQESEFKSAWLSLLEDPRFAAATAGNEILVILHPNFRRFTTDFEVSGVTVLQQGEVSVQELMRSSRLLITDYSSVGFDFALQHRPVVYYQFDRDRFLGGRGSHLDLDADLPGDVGLNREAVLEALEHRAALGFSQDPAHSDLADTYFPMRDTGSSARVFAAVAAAKHTRPSEVRRRAGSGARKIVRELRRRDLYVPLLRAFYRAARVLPLRKNLVVLECNLGRGYGDSPKAVYRELARSRPDLQFVWASHVPIPDATPNTTIVPRLSAAYFWNLARAKYLVNNQSFPFYVTRRRRQVFLQTWHGTPLKRMLHDLDKITGRDPGYVKRATTGAAQWSVVTSPNAHTTKALASAFRHSARVLEVGYPRNDIFYGDRARKIARRAKARLGIDKDRAMVLFAPTFRDRGLDTELLEGPTQAIDFTEFAREFGDRATLVIRRHVLDTHVATIPPELETVVVDATSVPDVQELLVAADVLVTDYSSLFFDFLNTRRPCVFFAPDLEDYRDNLRGFYLDYDSDLPGPVATDMHSLIPLLRTAIDEGAFDGYDLDAYARLYCPMDDGLAARRVVESVFGTGRR